MCNALISNKPTETIVKKPSETLPVPPAQPDVRMLGDGTVRKAASEANRRKVRQALEIERQTQ